MVDAASNGVLSHAGVSVAFAFVVIAMIFALGHLSGAHINPAVTIAFWSVKRFPGRSVLPYVAAQCGGAIVASTVLRAILSNVGSMGATLPARALGIGSGAAFSIEALLSFVLMFVIMAVATDKRVADGFAAIAVGLTVGFCAMVRATDRSLNESCSVAWPGGCGQIVGRTLALLGCAHPRDARRGEVLRVATQLQYPSIGDRILKS